METSCILKHTSCCICSQLVTGVYVCVDQLRAGAEERIYRDAAHLRPSFETGRIQALACSQYRAIRFWLTPSLTANQLERRTRNNKLLMDFPMAS